jgi:hypothetical protein
MSADTESQPARPRDSRASAIALVGLVEITLVAIIVIALAGSRIALTAEWLELVPGGRWAVAGACVLLLLLAAFVMTLLLSR